MIEEYVPSDTHRDDFCERFREPRVQKLNDPKKPLQTIQFLFI